MGRPKKTVDEGSPSRSPRGLEKLRAQLEATQAEIQRLHEEEPDRMLGALRLAALHARAWDLEGLLATDINVRLACARQSASWAEQQVRAAKAVQVDLLRELFEKAEQMQRHHGALKELQ